MDRFENYLTEQNDALDNLAYRLLCQMADPNCEDDDEPIEWDMELIGEVVSTAETVLLQHGIEPCHPFYEGDERVLCYLGNDCKKKDCPFRKGTE